MRIFSLVALIIVVIVVGYLAFHLPSERNALDSFAALNVEAAISAVNGTILAAMLFMIARTLLYLVVGAAVNFARLRWRQALLMALILGVKLVIAWLIYLGLFTYSREVGFTRILWNLQDLGINADTTSVVVVSMLSIACIAIVPDLLVNLISGRDEMTLLHGRRHGH